MSEELSAKDEEYLHRMQGVHGAWTRPEELKIALVERLALEERLNRQADNLDRKRMSNEEVILAIRTQLRVLGHPMPVETIKRS